MKFLVAFTVTLKDKQGWTNTKTVRYTVSSPVELFDRLIKLRHREHLDLVEVGHRNRKRYRDADKLVAAVHPEPGGYDYNSRARVRFTPDALVTIEKLEEVATAIWHVLETFANSSWDRSGNEVPPQLRPYLERVLAEKNLKKK